MISAFWMIPILCGIAGLFAAVSRRRSEEMFAPAIFAIIMVLYVFALAGAPVLGYQVVRVLGLAAFAAAIIASVRSRETRARLWTPGCVVFVLWIAVAWWAHRGQPYYTYDEFNHWGRAVNRLYALEKLPSSVPGALEYPSYPPGSTLFYCFWTWLGGNFSEGSTISAANVMLGACMTPLMRSVEWKRWKHILPMALVCVMLPMVFKHNVYQDLYVDVLLGCIAAYALVIWLTTAHDLPGMLMLCAAMAALVLVKESGMGIAMLALLVMAVDAWHVPKAERKKDFVWLGVAVLCMVAAMLSWKSYLSACGVVSEKAFRSWEIASNLQAFISGNVPNYLKDQYRNFFTHLTSSVMMGGGHILQLNYLEWLLVMALAACWLKRREAESRYSRTICLLMAVTVIYAVILYHTYLYAFSREEMVSLHSFERYMSSIMLPMLAAALAMAQKSFELHPPKALPGTMILLTCLALVVPPYDLVSLTFGAPYQIEAVQQARAKAAPAPYTLQQLEPDDRVAWLSKDSEDTFLEYVCNRYEFLPVQIEVPCEYRLADQTLEDVQQGLLASSCEYAYCYRVDEAFKQEFAALFENPQDIANTTLYEIIRDGNTVLLRRVI